MTRTDLEEVLRDLFTMTLDAMSEIDTALQDEDDSYTEDDIDILQQLSWEADYLSDTAKRFLYD